jgi:hypothetical protein
LRVSVTVAPRSSLRTGLIILAVTHVFLIGCITFLPSRSITLHMHRVDDVSARQRTEGTAMTKSARRDFTGGSAPVVGGSSGLGRATAVVLRAYGADRVILARDEERSARAALEIGCQYELGNLAARHTQAEKMAGGRKDRE